MRPQVERVHELVRGHQPPRSRAPTRTLRWLESTDDVLRRVKPATPSRHLVSYVAMIDQADSSSLLVVRPAAMSNPTSTPQPPLAAEPVSNRSSDGVIPAPL
jgi:hypothetical protein